MRVVALQLTDAACVWLQLTKEIHGIVSSCSPVHSPPQAHSPPKEHSPPASAPQGAPDRQHRNNQQEQLRWNVQQLVAPDPNAPEKKVRLAHPLAHLHTDKSEMDKKKASRKAKLDKLKAIASDAEKESLALAAQVDQAKDAAQAAQTKIAETQAKTEADQQSSRTEYQERRVQQMVSERASHRDNEHAAVNAEFASYVEDLSNMIDHAATPTPGACNSPGDNTDQNVAIL